LWNIGIEGESVLEEEDKEPVIIYHQEPEWKQGIETVTYPHFGRVYGLLEYIVYLSTYSTRVLSLLGYLVYLGTKST